MGEWISNNKSNGLFYPMVIGLGDRLKEKMIDLSYLLHTLGLALIVQWEFS